MRLALLTVLVTLLPTMSSAESTSERLGRHLAAAEYDEAVDWLEAELERTPESSDLRFALGITKALAAIEDLGRAQHRYGALAGTVRTLPVLRIPVPPNPEPEPVSYDNVRAIFEQFQTQIAAAEQELAAVDLAKPIKVRVDVASVNLDLNGDGEIAPTENFLAVLAAVNRPRGGLPDEMVVAFDNGDVPWLRGYCHFLMAFCDMVLAYDHQRLFDHCGQLVYPKPVRSEEVLVPLETEDADRGVNSILDAIAAIHLCVFPVREAERMESARQHFLMMARTSRESWELILAETDDDAEWVPSPKQTGVLPMPVSQEIVDGWLEVLDEMEAILEGRKLVPFWRTYSPNLFGGMPKVPSEGVGVNVKRLCADPREFDLVLTVQGTAVLPFVEEGPLSTPETWRQLRRVFRGNFFGFAVWFN